MLSHDMDPHRIVYLDVNYLSNLAKARSNYSPEDHDSQFWSLLFDDIREAVLADRVACPELDLQRDEASFDSRIEPVVWEILGELSLWLEFRPSERIMQQQIEDAAFRFMGKELPERESWVVAFRSDPQEAVARRMQALGPVKVHLSWSPRIVEHDRRVREKGRDTREGLLKLPAHASFRKELLAQKVGLVDHILGRANMQMILEQWQSDQPRDRAIGLDNFSKLKERWTRLRQMGLVDVSEAVRFLNSDELLNAPYVDIFSSISAVIFKNYKDRTPKGSDSYDLKTLATVLPYCDIVTTDGFMKQVLVEELHFDRKYTCRVFSCSKSDRVAFRELIRQLE